MKKFKNATMNDIFAGIIVAFISIPISMGYAQVAGLPMVYGLYGSLVPILVFSLFTTSHDFVGIRIGHCFLCISNCYFLAYCTETLCGIVSVGNLISSSICK